MSKKEKIFPLNTIGGRIQKKRHDLELSRRDLYNMVYQDRTDETVSDSSKEKTVYNWESGTTELSYATLCSLCKTLNCSSDYLLGLDECSSKNAQFVYNATGLSEAPKKYYMKLSKHHIWENYCLKLSTSNRRSYFFFSAYRLYK